MRNNENTDVQQFIQINCCWHLVCFIFGGIFPLFKCHVESLSISRSRRFCNTPLLLRLTQAVMSQPPLLVVGLIQRKVTLCYINQNTSMQLEVISVLCYGTNNKRRHLPVFSLFYTTLKTKLSESYKRHCFSDIYDQILDCKLTPQCAVSPLPGRDSAGFSRLGVGSAWPRAPGVHQGVGSSQWDPANSN